MMMKEMKELKVTDLRVGDKVRDIIDEWLAGEGE